MDNSRPNALSVLNIVAFAVTLIMNALSQFMPLNGVTPREVSEEYPNLFTPAPITFSIWGVIYLLLAVFVLYQAGAFGNDRGVMRDRIGILFILSCVFNVAWIFCWHYFLIPLSLVCMAGLLVTLAILFVKITPEPLTLIQSLCVKLPFAVYFGWITVAFISNVSAALVSVGWNGFGIADELWTVIVLILGTVIALAVVLTRLSCAYGIAAAWAFIGIVIKHVSSDGYAGEYPRVIAVAAGGALILIAASIYAAIKYNDRLKSEAES